MDSRRPTISVVIPTFNRAVLLERALESVAQQSVVPDEVIVSDDGSTDGTESVVKRYENRLSIEYMWRPNSGLPAVARNVGLQAATGDFVAFLDSDDWWAPRKIESFMKSATHSVDVSYHPMLKVPSTSSLWFGRQARARGLRRPVHSDLRRRGNVIPNSSAVVRRTVLEDVGGLVESRDRRTWEDFDLWLRVSTRTDRFEIIREPLGYYSTEGGVTNPQQTLENLANYQACWGSPELSEPGWMRTQRAIALARSGDHARAARAAVGSLGFPGTLRFRSDLLLVSGLAVREGLLAIRRSGTTSRKHSR
jgi:glycosyltransferase involved in cell wall biosynthesis